MVNVSSRTLMDDPYVCSTGLVSQFSVVFSSQIAQLYHLAWNNWTLISIL